MITPKDNYHTTLQRSTKTYLQQHHSIIGFTSAMVVKLSYQHHLYHNSRTPDILPKAPHKNRVQRQPFTSQSRTLCRQRNVQKRSQHSKEIPPLSAPSNSRRFNGKTAIEAMTPRNVSERSLVLVKMALLSMEVCTLILLAVVPDTTPVLCRLRHVTGSVAPLR